ncbi:MAG: ABC transporter ATP-binding protein [Dehalococcoidia bacterium]|nr:ABC transporter ATP-binding protein [Dehalococcoidia bacterium]
MDTVVEVGGLSKNYGNLIAVNEVSFAIRKGEIFGLLGPNGAGKTTTVELIEGLRKPDAGFIKVCGIDTSERTDRVKELIGVQLQTTTIYNRIRVGEAIELFGSYYQRSLRTDEILDEVSLNDKKNSFVEVLSGGQRQRLALALALINDPEILFLDEPTTGLDPQARRNVWDIIERLRERGKTVILTTHYMEEAERLCNRLGVMDYGKIIALDTPRDLIAKQNLESAVEFITSKGVSKGFLQKLPKVSKITKDGDRFVLRTKEAFQVLVQLTRLSESNGFNLESISVRKATLEDVFLELTGRKLRE